MTTTTTFCSSNLLTQISGLVFDDDHNLYACNFGTPTATIVQIDSHGVATSLIKHDLTNENQPTTADDKKHGKKHTTQTGSRNFASMVLLGKQLYVTGFNHCVYTLDVNSGNLKTLVTLPDFGTNGMTYSNGALYVITADASNNGMSSGSVYKVDPKHGTFEVFIDKNVQNLSGTQYNMVDTDAHGNFYITDEGNGTVVQYDPSGKLINKSFISGPYQSILIDNQHIYVSHYDANQICQYDMNGNLTMDNFAAGGLTFCGGGMAFDANGKFYCSLENPTAGSGNVTIQMK